MLSFSGFKGNLEKIAADVNNNLISANKMFLTETSSTEQIMFRGSNLVENLHNIKKI